MLRSIRTTIMPTLLRWRGRLIPESRGLGWTPIFLLGYLVFLFLPAVLAWFGETNRSGIPMAPLWPTLISIAVFLPIYFAGYRYNGIKAIACMLAIAAIGYAMLPSNVFANTYLIYAAGFAATCGGALWKRIGWLSAILAGLLLEIVLLRYPLFVFLVTTIVAVAVFFGNHHFIENRRKRAELQLSHDEIRRLAALAERERIGRDLHDLLGHTLSLVALKSELAGKLIDRDPQAARRELNEVTRVARDALTQVRSAVTGIRAAGLAAELASARLLLETGGVDFRYELAPVVLPPEVETVLAMTLREAVTNIERHARARHAQAQLLSDVDEVVLRVEDDGRGGAISPGNGLCGMRERIEALGGRLRVDSTPGRGTCIHAHLPLRNQSQPGDQDEATPRMTLPPAAA
ncbi:sensor histidine kinase [Lysobacter niastensis]|uniref:Sensor histidine kinase n=1 Tax=Lysobacter niastensis TaxID=380629 RepID=A0ABS0BDN7_9GAMM|nr:sensor histidine kinase [Lysobacter niastensis]MBF6025124.1 sensor histidine kinase [Lysobacter niastensis]